MKNVAPDKASKSLTTDPNADPLEELDSFDRVLLTAKVENPRITNKKLAKDFHADTKTIYRRLKKPGFKIALDVLTKERAKTAFELLDEHTANAIRKLAQRSESSEKEQTEVFASKALLEFSIGKKDRHSFEDVPDVLIDFIPPKKHPKRKNKKKTKS